MASKLTIQNAQITTAAVEIKTLTISGKQVTLAVFRQLREEPLVAENGTFNGLPWGTVNYHPDKCGDSGDHLHVVWQRDADLRRANISKPYWSRYWSEEVQDFAQAAYCNQGHEIPANWQPWYGAKEVRFEVDSIKCEADANFTAPFRTAHAGQDPGHECSKLDLAALKADIAVEADRRSRHRARWAELCDLPQLFIAV